MAENNRKAKLINVNPARKGSTMSSYESESFAVQFTLGSDVNLEPNVAPSTNQQPANSDEPTITLKQVIMPQLVIMRLFGLYHRQSDGKLFKLYCKAVCLIGWINFVRLIGSLNAFHGKETSFNKSLVTQLVGVLWTLFGATHCTLLYVNHRKADDRFHKYHDYCQRLVESSLSYKKSANRPTKELLGFVKRLRLVTWSIVMMFLTFFSGNLVLMYFSFFGPKYFLPMYQEYLAPLSQEAIGLDNVPYKIMISLLMLFSSGAPCASSAYFILNCILARIILLDYNSEFKHFVSLNSCLHSSDTFISTTLSNQERPNINSAYFEYMRQWHAKICYSIRLLNQACNKLVAFALICLIPSVLLLLFMVSDPVTNCIKDLFAFTYSSWLIFSFSIIMLNSIIGAMINANVSDKKKIFFYKN